MVTHSEAAHGPHVRLERSPLARAAARAGLGAGVRAARRGHASAASCCTRRWTSPPTRPVSCSRRWPWRSSAAWARAGVRGARRGLLLNYFFVPPVYTLNIATAGEPGHADHHDGRRGAGGAGRGPGGAAGDPGRAGAHRGRAAGVLRAHRADPPDAADPVAGEGAGELRSHLGGAAGTRRHGEWHRVACVGPQPCDEPDEADVDVPGHPGRAPGHPGPRTAGRRPAGPGGRGRAGAARAAPAADDRAGRRRASARPRPPNCAPRCCPPSATTCAPR